NGIALAPDGSAAYIVEVRPGDPAGDRLVRLDLGTGAVTGLIEGLEGGEELVLDPTGSRAYLSEERASRIVAVDLATGQATPVAQPLPASGMVLVPRPACSGGFLTLPPKHGTVPKHVASQLPLTASAKKLPPGHYTATLEVRGNDPLRPLSIVPIVFDVLPDADADGIADRDDDCPAVANADQADADADRHGDLCDNCPAVPNPGQADLNADGAGDACQTSLSIVAIRQDGGPFVVVRLALTDPLGLPVSGDVSLLDAAAVAGAEPVFSIPFEGRPPRRIDLAPLLAGRPYRLRISASNGTTIPFVAEALFQHGAETTLAFNEPPVARIAPIPTLECDRAGGAL